MIVIPDRRPAVIGVGVAVTLLSVATYLAAPPVRRPGDDVADRIRRVDRKLADARRTGAARWAPDLFAEAEATYLAGRSEPERLQRAGRLADLAVREARRRRADGRDMAARSMQGARRVIDVAESFAGRVVDLRRSGGGLARARASMIEAETDLASEDYGLATLRARDAERQARSALAGAAASARRYVDRRLLDEWRGQVERTVARSRRTGQVAVIVVKDDHRLDLVDDGRFVGTYRVDLGVNGLADKRRAGDGATPEGGYRVVARLDRGRSRFHRALVLDYPSRADRVRFHRERDAGGIPSDAEIGGGIEIHGHGGTGRDWTDGCIALSDDDMDELFARVRRGTAVTIVGADGEGGTYTELASSAAPRSGGPGR